MPASSTLKFNAILLSRRTKVCNTIVIEHVRIVHPCQVERGRKIRGGVRRHSHRQKQNKEVFPSTTPMLKNAKKLQQKMG